MLRIDENTYIDDTLVTCAEYQLFIDEKREQGEYFQPDHWTSYQFPAGQALTPIVGVRFNEAKVFCEWLSIRDGMEWYFRLPTLAEIGQYPIQKLAQTPLGYWTVRQGDVAQFSWVGSQPVNPRALDLTLDLDIKLVYTLEIDRALDFNIDNSFILDIDRMLATGQALARKHKRDHSHYLDITRARDRVRVLFHASDLTRFRDRTYTLEREINQVLVIARELVDDLILIYNYSNKLAINLALYIYFDYFTLQERIAGRSPAFEGIRFVKERKP